MSTPKYPIGTLFIFRRRSCYADERFEGRTFRITAPHRQHKCNICGSDDTYRAELSDSDIGMVKLIVHSDEIFMLDAPVKRTRRRVICVEIIRRDDRTARHDVI